MYEPNQRIQFFNSESSFGSSSNLPQSKYYDFTNQLIGQTNNIFAVLKRQLQPNERQSHQDKIQYSIRRAQVLQKDTIPEHVAYLNRIQAPHNAKIQVEGCREKLCQLLGDYQKLRKGTMIYKQFYNKYAKDNIQDNNLSVVSIQAKEESIASSSAPFIKQQSVEINSQSDRVNKNGAMARVFLKENKESLGDKQVSSLKQEIVNLRKVIEENRKAYQLQLIHQRMLFEKRIKTYLCSSVSQGSTEREQILKGELKQYNEKLQQSLQENIKLQQTINRLNKQIKMVQYEKEISHQHNNLSTIEKLHQEFNKYYRSLAQDKREEKLLKNLIQENGLLLSQIRYQRKKLSQIQSNLSEQQRRQCERNRQRLVKKKVQLEELYSSFDKQRVELMQLSFSHKLHSQTLSQLKKQNEQLKQISSNPTIPLTSQDYVPPSILSFSVKTNQFKSAPKLVVQAYEGDGIEGFPYYQMLSKQFRTRFRRACLRQKQLIYKANNIQIGTITKFYPPNTIRILIHLTNCSEGSLTNMKIKAMNANENVIDGSNYQYHTLAANEQIKIPVTLTIHQYPIGPLILLLEYELEKREEVRILLPAHLIKTMTIQERTTDMNLLSCSRVVLMGDRKICKDINDLRQLFNIAKNNAQIVKLSVYHEHTHTLVQMDIVQTKQGLEVMYKQVEGMREISEYFIKTFVFLIRKESIK